MHGRWLFALRERAAEPGVWLGAWQLSVGLMALSALYQVFLAVWARSAPPHVVRNIAALAPYWILYTLLLVNTGVCLWRRLGLLRQQLGAHPWLAHGAADWQVALPPGVVAGGPRALLARLGYRARTLEDGSAWGVRRRFAALGTYLFHGAFSLIAAGFLLSLALRHEAGVWVAVGEEYVGSPEQVRSESPPGPLSTGLPELRFGVRSITPQFWRDELLFTRLEAELELHGRAVFTRINRPVWLAPATFLRLSGFGYAPRYELRDAAGRVLDSAYVKLDVFPPGRRDWFRLEGYPHRFYVDLLPDFALEDGQPVTRSLNLVRPAARLRVLRGRVDLGGALLEPGQSFEFEGLRLAFPEVRYWGEFAVVRDPGAPLLFTGFALGLLGLVLKLAGARAEARLEPDGAGGFGLRGWGGRAPAPARWRRS